jgi:phage major head subunit gpT-like protein
MDLTPASLNVFFTGLSTIFQQGYASYPPWWSQVAMTVPSDTELETFGWADVDDFVMREWVGPRVVGNTALRSRSLVNKDWEKTKSIPRNKFADDKLGLYNLMAQAMGEDAAKLHDRQLVALIRSNPICFDGKAFFADDHPIDIDKPASGVNDNLMAGTPLTPTNFGLARARMRGFRMRNGEPGVAEPTLLIVPPSLADMAMTITMAENIASLAAGGSLGNGDVGSTTNIYRGCIKVLVIKELEVDPTTWYLLDNSGVIKPFLVQIRQAPQFVSLNNPTDANVFFKKEFIFGVDSRSAYDVTLPFKALRAAA